MATTGHSSVIDFSLDLLHDRDCRSQLLIENPTIPRLPNVPGCVDHHCGLQLSCLVGQVSKLLFFFLEQTVGEIPTV